MGRVDSNSHEAPRLEATPTAALELGGDGAVFLLVGRRGTSRASRVWFQINLNAGKECATGINAKKKKIHANLLTSYRGESQTTAGVFPV